MNKTAATITTAALAIGGAFASSPAAHAAEPKDPNAPVLVTEQQVWESGVNEGKGGMTYTDDDGHVTTGVGETPISARIGARDCHSAKGLVTQVTCGDFENGTAADAANTLRDELNAYSKESMPEGHWYSVQVDSGEDITVYEHFSGSGSPDGWSIVMEGESQVGFMWIDSDASFDEAHKLAEMAMTY